MKQKLQILTKIAFVFLAFLGLAKGADAQCVAGEVEVFLDVTTDTWGYELYWELAPTGSACGTAAIFAGGNTAVGCAGGGGQVAAGTDPGAYPNSATTTEPQTATGFCLTIGNDYDIIMIDDWGDGGNTITSVAQSVNAVPTSGTETFTFTAVAPPVGPDAVMTTSAPEYTIYPLVQVGNIVSDGNIENIGVADATGVTMTVNVYELTGQTVVYTATSASGTVTIGANNNFTVPGFTPTTVENYFVEYIASITETDDNMVNDTTGYIIQVSDSTFARDDANINGVSGGLGIGAGAAANGKLGQMFALTVSDTLTSVDVFLRNTNSLLYGQPLVIELYDVVAGFPNTLLASSTSITLDSTENTLWNVDFSDYYMVAGEYAVVKSGSNNIDFNGFGTQELISATNLKMIANYQYTDVNSESDSLRPTIDYGKARFYKVSDNTDAVFGEVVVGEQEVAIDCFFIKSGSWISHHVSEGEVVNDSGIWEYVIVGPDSSFYVEKIRSDYEVYDEENMGTFIFSSLFSVESSIDFEMTEISPLEYDLSIMFSELPDIVATVAINN